MRNSSSRLFLMMPFAAVVTVGIFLAMGSLIQNETVLDGEPKTVPDIRFLREIEPPAPRPTPPQPDVFKETPPPERPRPNDWTPDNPTDRTIPAPKPTPTPSDPGGTSGIRPGADIPAYPIYPERCRSRGIEGYATVQFDVDERGEAFNITVTDTTDTCFNKEAIRAIQNSKFSPGKARRGQTRTFRFDLEG